MREARILATGSYVPPNIVDNALLARVMDTTDAWITQRTGIRERRVVEPAYRMLQELAAAPDREAYLEQLFEAGWRGDPGDCSTSSDLAAMAARRALANAGLTARDIDLVLVDSLIADRTFPGCACAVAAKLGASGAPAITTNQGCAAFPFLLSTAQQYVRTGAAERVLVVSSVVMSSALEYSTRGRGMAVLFGDGAGAAIVGPAAAGDTGRILSCHLHTDGTQIGKLHGDRFGSTTFPCITRSRTREERYLPRMDGTEVFMAAVDAMRGVVEECLGAHDLTHDAVHHFFFHQANSRIIDEVIRDMPVPRERVPMNLERYGNMSGASLPVLFDETVAAGKVQPGDLCLLASFGTGFSWSGALLSW